MRRSRYQRDERGSALVLALVALAFFALMLTATLAATETGLHTSQTNKAMPPKLYGADGALDSAIQQVRGDASIGTSGDADCGPNSQPNGQLRTTANGQTIYVQCSGLPGSGELAGGGSSPTLGILTLATGTEVGYRQGGNAIVRLDGGLYANSAISFDQGSTCDGSNSTCSQLNLCPKNGRTVTDASYATNSFNVTSATARFIAGDLGSVLKGAGIPAGTTIKSVLSATQVALSTKPDAGATNGTITFREFPFSQTACHPPAGTKGNITVLGACADAGTIARIVAVTKSASCGGDPGPPSSVGQDPLFDPDQETGFVDRAIPACGSALIVDFLPGRYTDGAGLNALTASCSKVFWFHPGTYYFDLPSGSDEWSLSNANVTVVAGDKSWDARGVITGSINNNNTTVTAPSGTFSAADVNKFITSGNNLPYGTFIKAYNNSGSVTISATPLGAASTFTINSGKAMCVEGDNGEPGAQFIFGKDSRIKQTDGRFEICAPAWNDAGKQRIGVYGVKTARGSLDPGSPTGCTKVTPYPSASACARINVGGPKTVFLVHGTIYTPASAVDLTLSNVGYQIVSRGIVTRMLALGISPSADYTDPVIYSPDFGSTVPDDRRVLFTACLSAPCGASGSKTIIKSVVQFVDSDPADDFADPYPGFGVKVRSWSVIR